MCGACTEILRGVLGAWKVSGDLGMFGSRLESRGCHVANNLSLHFLSPHFFLSQVAMTTAMTKELCAGEQGAFVMSI